MNYKNWKFWFTILVVFIFGMIIVPKNTIETEQCDYSIWQELKIVDDKGFKQASDGFYIATDAFQAFSEFDFVKIENITQKLNENSELIKKTADERLLILKKLGY